MIKKTNQATTLLCFGNVGYFFAPMTSEAATVNSMKELTISPDGILRLKMVYIGRMKGFI